MHHPWYAARMALPRRGPAPARRDALDWRDFALCRDADPEIFFPTAESGPALQRAEAEALEWCALCPVRAECLAFALERLPYGIAGGMTARQRRTLRDRQRDTESAPGARRPGPFDAPTREVRAAGIELLIKGELPRAAIAERLRVSRRTVDRWAVRPECVAAGVVPADPNTPHVHILSRAQARRIGARRVS